MENIWGDEAISSSRIGIQNGCSSLEAELQFYFKCSPLEIDLYFICPIEHIHIYIYMENIWRFRIIYGSSVQMDENLIGSLHQPELELEQAIGSSWLPLFDFVSTRLVFLIQGTDPFTEKSYRYEKPHRVSLWPIHFIFKRFLLKMIQPTPSKSMTLWLEEDWREIELNFTFMPTIVGCNRSLHKEILAFFFAKTNVGSDASDDQFGICNSLIHSFIYTFTYS